MYRIGKNIAAEGKDRKKTTGEVAGLPPEIYQLDRSLRCPEYLVIGSGAGERVADGGW